MRMKRSVNWDLAIIGNMAEAHMTCGSWHDLQHGSSRLDSGLDENGPVAATIETAASNTRQTSGLNDMLDLNLSGLRIAPSLNFVRVDSGPEPLHVVYVDRPLPQPARTPGQELHVLI